MQHLTVLSFLCVLLACSASKDQTQPGASFGFSQKALDYVQTVAVPLLQSKLLNIPIPNVAGEAKGFDYVVDHIRITQFMLGSTSLHTDASGVYFMVSNIDVSLSADWKYREHDLHFPSGSGTLKAKIGGASSIMAAISLRVDSGRLVCTPQSVNTRIDHLDITVSGSMFSWLYNLILDSFNNSVKKTLISNINSSLNDFITNDVNRALASSNPVIHLPLPSPFNALYVDMTPMLPVLSPLGIDMQVRGNVWVAGQPQYTVAPPVLPSPDPSAFASHMLCVTLTSFVPNSGLSSLFSSSLLQYQITPSVVPSSATAVLNTTFIRSIAPDLYHAYPNCALDVLVSSSLSAPVFSSFLSPVSGPVVSAMGQTDFLFRVVADDCNHVQNVRGGKDNSENKQQEKKRENGNEVGELIDAFVLTCAMNVSGVPWVEGNTVHANLTQVECVLATKSSNFGNIQASKLNPLVSSLLTEVLIPQINDEISGGLPIPSLEGVSLYNGLVTVDAPDSLQVYFDMKYEPSLKKQSEENDNGSEDEIKKSNVVVDRRELSNVLAPK